MKIKIADLTPNIGNFILVAKVVEKSKEAAWGAKEYASAIIEDETGRITLNLHENQVDQVEVGQNVRISGAFTEINGKFLEISSWKKIELVKDY
jgi:ssDNA-binding replication factor A large subunit